MKLSVNGIKDHEVWEKAGIMLPGYDVEGGVYWWYCGWTS